MEYILDYKKWRCGNYMTTQLGKGPTLMLNPQGFQCCLGQWAVQKGVPKSACLGKGGPYAVATELGIIYDPLFVCKNKFGYELTKLSERAMQINDHESLSIAGRIEGLRSLLSSKGHTIRVINLPKNLKELAK